MKNRTSRHEQQSQIQSTCTKSSSDNLNCLVVGLKLRLLWLGIRSGLGFVLVCDRPCLGCSSCWAGFEAGPQ